MFVKLTGLFARCWKDQIGATAIEYGFIAVLISIAGIAAFATLGDSLSNVFLSVNSDVENSTPGDRDGGAANDAAPTNAVN